LFYLTSCNEYIILGAIDWIARIEGVQIMTKITLASKTLYRTNWQGFEMTIEANLKKWSHANVLLDGEKVGEIIQINGVWKNASKKLDYFADSHPYVPAQKIAKEYFS
jgi:hypothetical protein